MGTLSLPIPGAGYYPDTYLKMWSKDPRLRPKIPNQEPILALSSLSRRSTLLDAIESPFMLKTTPAPDRRGLGELMRPATRLLL